jgi:hypothetical protein
VSLFEWKAIYINESSMTMKSPALPCRLYRLNLIDERKKNNQDAPPKSNYSSDLHRGRSSSTASKSIPIEHDHLKSQEDWEFRVQEMLAEERDRSMFARIVNGMITRQGSEHSSSYSCQGETDKIIARIMRTRYMKLDSKSPSTDDSEIFAYDDQTEQMYNGHRDPFGNQNSEEDDRPPDAIFIMDM